MGTHRNKKRNEASVAREMIMHPHDTDQQIADRTDLARSTVANARKAFRGTLQYELARKVADGFLTDFTEGYEYMRGQIGRLDDLTEKLQEDLLTGQVRREIHQGMEVNTKLVNPDMHDRLEIYRALAALEKQKTELRAKMLNMAKQGEAVAVLRMIRDKRIKVPEAVEAAENATEIGLDGRVVRALEDRTIDVDGKVEELPDTKAEFRDGRHLG